jgi:hypothetical protein
LSWFDDAGISLLFYAVVADEETAIVELLDEILSVKDKKTRQRRLSSRVPRHGIVQFGIPGEMTALMMAMCTSSPDIVVHMMKAGADPFETDKGGHDALMAAAMYVFRLDDEIVSISTAASPSLLHATQI